MMRPVVQKVICSIARSLVSAETCDWETYLGRISALNWTMGSAPWRAVWDAERSKMRGAKDNKELLADLLRVHLCPLSRAAIQKSRKSYKLVCKERYPVSEEELMKHLVLED